MCSGPHLRNIMELRSSGPILLLLLVTLVCTTSANVANIARSLSAEYELINHNPGGTYYASIILTNQGELPIDASGGWSLYFCHENLIEFERFNTITGDYRPTRRGGFVLSHIKGCMYKFTPDPSIFTTITPNERRRITFLAAASISGLFDIYPHFYIADKNQSSVISNTKDYRYYITPFKDIFQYTRDPPRDPILPVSPVRSYAVLANQTYPQLTPADILPTPLSTQYFPGEKVVIDSSWRFFSGAPQRTADLMSYFTKTLDIPDTKAAKTNNVIMIAFSTAPSVVENSEEWYKISISARHKYVKIEAQTTHGLLNGFQTLLNLLQVKVMTDKTRTFEVPVLIISDAPRFKHRALLLDVASNFVSLSTVKKLLRIMALVKLNKLQLLLANDYGVRLEITTMPGFHTVGSRRCHDETEESCLFSQLGSDPSGDGRGSGHYTAREYIELLSLAKQLHIEIIPMWSFDSNMRASEIAIRAYSKATNDQTMNWSLPQLDKTSHFKPNLFRIGKVDPCAVETFRFVRTIISTIKSYHTHAGYPLRTFSMGGEDTDIDAWLDKCRQRNIKNKPSNPYVNRKIDFNAMLANISIENQITLNAYDNQFTAYPTRCNISVDATDCPDWFTPYDLAKWLPPQFKVTVTHRDPRVLFLTRLQLNGGNFTNITNPRTIDERIKMTHERETKMRMFQRIGYPSIISMQDVLDFSIKEEPGPYVQGEMPFGRSPIPLQHVFSMWPESMCCSRYECIPRYPAGYAFHPSFPPPLCMENVTAPGPIGMQATISTRKVHTEPELFQLLFPRLIAFAERAWHRGSWENTVKKPIQNATQARIEEVQDFLKFKAILGKKLLPTLDKYQARYYMAPPGALMRNVTSNVNDMRRTVSARTEYPGFTAQIKTDLMPDFEDIVENKVYDGANAEFRTRNGLSTRFSRSEIVSKNFTDKYARGHMETMNKLADTQVLEFPIQTRFRDEDDLTGINSYTLRDELPLYFDKDFGRFFNRTGFANFQLIKPVLVQQELARRRQHMQMMQHMQQMQQQQMQQQQMQQGAAATAARATSQG